MTELDEIDLIIREFAEESPINTDNIIAEEETAEVSEEVAVAEETNQLTENEETDNSITTEPLSQSVEDTVEEHSLDTNTDNTTDHLDSSRFVPSQYARFKGSEWFNTVQTKDVTLAGLGGIGSWVSFFLGRLGVNSLSLYDPDYFEAHNRSGQFLSNSDVGKSKVSVASNMIHTFNSGRYIGVHTHCSYYDEFSSKSDIMICGFDNMDARKVFYKAWKEHVRFSNNPSQCLFIDGRLMAETFQVICITGDDIHNQQLYEKEFLFGSEEAERGTCTFTQTTHIAAMIGSYITSYFVNFCSNLIPGNSPRRLPFFKQYESALDIYDTIY